MTPFGSGAPRAKGAALQSTLAFLHRQYGEAVAQQVLTMLAPEDRDAVAALTPTDEVPYALMVRVWNAADAVMREREGAGDWAERAGEASIGGYGVQLYGGILRKPTPLEFLTQSISLFRLYYQPGDMVVVENAQGRAVLRLVGFDPLTTIFCRRLTGGLREAVALAGGEQARVRHVRCCIEGDAFCEWELQWTTDAALAPGA